MGAALRLVDEQPNGTVVRELVLELASERTTAREIIERRVSHEVARFNAERSDVFHGLVQPTGAEALLNGYRLRTKRSLSTPPSSASSPARLSSRMDSSCSPTVIRSNHSDEEYDRDTGLEGVIREARPARRGLSVNVRLWSVALSGLVGGLCCICWVGLIVSAAALAFAGCGSDRQAESIDDAGGESAPDAAHDGAAVSSDGAVEILCATLQPPSECHSNEVYILGFRELHAGGPMEG